jgi:hypothetical protein
LEKRDAAKEGLPSSCPSSDDASDVESSNDVWDDVGDEREELEDEGLVFLPEDDPSGVGEEELLRSRKGNEGNRKDLFGSPLVSEAVEVATAGATSAAFGAKEVVTSTGLLEILTGVVVHRTSQLS